MEDAPDEGSRAPAIVFSGVTKAFEGQKVLDDFNALFDSGKVTLLMGPSGRGKTTVRRLAAGLERPDGGSITIGPWGAELSFLFQEDRLLPWLNIYDNMVLGLLRDGESKASGSMTAEDKVIEMARALEIGDSL